MISKMYAPVTTVENPMFSNYFHPWVDNVTFPKNVRIVKLSLFFRKKELIDLKLCRWIYFIDRENGW